MIVEAGLVPRAQQAVCRHHRLQPHLTEQGYGFWEGVRLELLEALPLCRYKLILLHRDAVLAASLGPAGEVSKEMKVVEGKASTRKSHQPSLGKQHFQFENEVSWPMR